MGRQSRLRASMKDKKKQRCAALAAEKADIQQDAEIHSFDDSSDESTKELRMFDSILSDLEGYAIPAELPPQLSNEAHHLVIATEESGRIEALKEEERQREISATEAKKRSAATDEEISLLKRELLNLALERAEAEERMHEAFTEMESRLCRAMAEEEEQIFLLQENAVLKIEVKRLVRESESLRNALETMESKRLHEEEKIAEMREEIAELRRNLGRLASEKTKSDSEISLMKRDAQKGRAEMESKLAIVEKESKAIEERLRYHLLNTDQSIKSLSTKINHLSSMNGRITRLEKEDEAAMNKGILMQYQISKLQTELGKCARMEELEGKLEQSERDKRFILNKMRNVAEEFLPLTSAGDETGVLQALQHGILHMNEELTRQRKASARWKLFSSVVTAAVALVSVTFVVKFH